MGVFLQLVELLPGLFHGFAYYVLGFFRIAHQGGSKADEAWVHFCEQSFEVLFFMVSSPE